VDADKTDQCSFTSVIPQRRTATLGKCIYRAEAGTLLALPARANKVWTTRRPPSRGNSLRDLLDGGDRDGTHLDFIRPGKPVEKGYIENFNGWLRDEPG
jgi:hypothetical protein